MQALLSFARELGQVWLTFHCMSSDKFKLITLEVQTFVSIMAARWCIWSKDDGAMYTTVLDELSLGGARAGTLTSVIWTRLESEFLHHHRSKRIICLLYVQTTALCSRQQMAYNGKRAVPSPTFKPSQAWFASLRGWPSIKCTITGSAWNFLLVWMAVMSNSDSSLVPFTGVNTGV